MMPVQGATILDEDLGTKGNWIEEIGGEVFWHYGRDGYILCDD